jgi:tetratricopeptide (TPR) repeat protein
VAAALTASGLAHAEPPRRHQLDDQDLETMAAASPEAAKRFAEGEQRLAVADLKAAEAAFAAVRALVPMSGLAARRHAQVLTELGRKSEAIAACKQALIASRTGIDARACVATLMVGSGQPTVDEVAEALRLATWAKRLADQPFGDASLCEIAYRIGDDGMLQHCVDSLQALAPEHYETRRWAAAVPETSQWPRWLGWCGVALAGLGTLAHWLRALVARRARAALPAAAALIVLAFCSPARAEEPPPASSIEKLQELPKDPEEQKKVHWQLSSKFPINPDAPETSVPSIEARNKAPLEFGYYLQDLAAEGAGAERKQQFGVAARYWATLVKAVPDVATGYRRACKAYEQAGDLAKAIEYCAGALNQHDVQLDDFGQHARLVLLKRTLDPNDIVDLDAMVKHLQESKDGQPGLSLAGAHIACELGLRLEDKKRLDACTKTLAQGAPQDPKTLSFRWSYAMLRRDYGEARSLIADLKKAGMPDTAIQKLTTATADASAWWRRPVTYVIGLGVVVLLGWLMLKRKRPAAPAGGPSASPA